MQHLVSAITRDERNVSFAPGATIHLEIPEEFHTRFNRVSQYIVGLSNRTGEHAFNHVAGFQSNLEKY